MKWILYLVVGLALLIGGVVLIGYALPAQTSHVRSITLQQPPAAVFAVLADVSHFAEWNRNIEKVEKLPPSKGKEATRQTFNGGMTMVIVTTASQPPQHLVRTLDDAGGPFNGSWTYDISPVEGGSRVALTELSIFKNPLYRVLARIFGATKYMDEHLQDLAKKLGENATVH